MIEEAPAYGRALAGRSIIGQVRTGSYQEVASHRARNEPGWIYVVPVTDLPGTRCGQALIGANPGFIELNANNRDCLDLEVFAHEIGHALGFFHVDPAVYPHAVMKPQGWQVDSGQYRFTAQEKFHARLAYQVGRGHEYCGWPFQRGCATARRARAHTLAPTVID